MIPRALAAVALAAAAHLPICAQTPAPEEVSRLGPGISPPSVKSKVEPEYPRPARDAGVQGSVLFQVVIDEKGRPTQITIVRPIGYGLDESARSAVEQWEFEPARKNGVPIKLMANIEVNFKLLGRYFDPDFEKRRAAFNAAARVLYQPLPDPKATANAVTAIEDLAHQKFPAALHLLGLWRSRGQHGPKDTAEAISYFEKAAKLNYGPALYELAIRRLKGEDLTRDETKALEELRTASTLGSGQAQLALAERYADDEKQAEPLLRLCASEGLPECQYRLGMLLASHPARFIMQREQAVAWLHLASEQGHAEAKRSLDDERAKLTADQLRHAVRMKDSLVRK